jgi:hypothetical protein
MLSGVSPPEERRKIRERTWAGGVAHSFAEMEDADLEFWLAMAVDRLKMMWSLVEDGLALNGNRGSAPTSRTHSQTPLSAGSCEAACGSAGKKRRASRVPLARQEEPALPA